MNWSQLIKQKAVELGFDLVGITDAAVIGSGQSDLLTDWLACGFSGRMSYMHRNLEKRVDPTMLLKNAQSVICLGLNYKLPKHPPPLPSNAQQSHSVNTTIPVGTVAAFAQYEDYHLFIKKLLRKLTVFINSVAGTGFKFRICVDSAPVAERALAVRAGLGFIGKNHMLINPEFGPQILLGEIITTLKLEPDGPIENSCANCNKCIAACPTGALLSDGRFDANKCISYLTIEYKDRIPSGLTTEIGNRLFGCDECVLSCPYQKRASVCKNKQFRFYSDRAKLNLREVLSLSEDKFGEEFADSCFKYSGLERLKRNAQICLSNTTYPPI